MIGLSRINLHTQDWEWKYILYFNFFLLIILNTAFFKKT